VNVEGLCHVLVARAKARTVSRSSTEPCLAIGCEERATLARWNLRHDCQLVRRTKRFVARFELAISDVELTAGERDAWRIDAALSLGTSPNATNLAEGARPRSVLCARSDDNRFLDGVAVGSPR